MPNNPPFLVGGEGERDLSRAGRMVGVPIVVVSFVPFVLPVLSACLLSCRCWSSLLRCAFFPSSLFFSFFFPSFLPSFCPPPPNPATPLSSSSLLLDTHTLAFFVFHPAPSSSPLLHPPHAPHLYSPGESQLLSFPLPLLATVPGPLHVVLLTPKDPSASTFFISQLSFPLKTSLTTPRLHNVPRKKPIKKGIQATIHSNNSENKKDITFTSTESNIHLKNQRTELLETTRRYTSHTTSHTTTLKTLSCYAD